MQIRTRRIPRARYLARAAKEVSRAARQRLRWMDHYESHGRNAAFTCRYFGISWQTFYRWRRRYDPQDLLRLEERSHRPHRRPTWMALQVEQVLRLQLEYPRWGKDQLAVLLGREGCRPTSNLSNRSPRLFSTPQPENVVSLMDGVASPVTFRLLEPWQWLEFRSSHRRKAVLRRRKT